MDLNSSVTHSKNLYIKSEFQHITTSPHHHQANGMVERANHTVRRILEKTEGDLSKAYLCLLHLRNTPKMTDTGSPAQRLFGRRVRTKLPTSRKLLQPQVQDPVLSKRCYWRNETQPRCTTIEGQGHYHHWKYRTPSELEKDANGNPLDWLRFNHINQDRTMWKRKRATSWDEVKKHHWERMRDIFNPEPPDVNIPDATPPVPRPNPSPNPPPIAQAHPKLQLGLIILIPPTQIEVLGRERVENL